MIRDADNAADPFDLAVVGGGINGCGIARDAAGRGLSVLLLEQGDLASATSSSSSKLIHGGIRYLEHYNFKLVRESLIERDIIFNIAPHISRPLRFVFPHNPGMRPMWMIRAGLFLYDHLGGREFPRSRRIPDVGRDEAGCLLKPEFSKAFEYSDCWIDDARLVILNARDAAANGAMVLPRTQCTRATSSGGVWHLETRNVLSDHTRSFTARELVNATGPWASSFLSGAVKADLETPSRTKTRNVKGSHLVTKKWFEHDRAYILQSPDRRIVFVLPFEDDYVLIGTTDMDHDGDPGQVSITEQERRYLLDCVNQYFTHQVRESDVLASFSGVRPLYDDGASQAQETTRDHKLEYSKTRDGAGLLNVFGGKLTTYRTVAESALHVIERATQDMPPPWTAGTPLPGGRFPPSRKKALKREYAARYPFVPDAVFERWFRSYGLDIDELLAGAGSRDDLGAHFGAGLYEIEISWMIAREWARTSEDILWRRSKLGLRMTDSEVAALDAWLDQNTKARVVDQRAKG